MKKVIELLDSVNEETTYNKLLKSWKLISTFKRDPSKPLNEYFSEFETLHYSLNLADDTFKEIDRLSFKSEIDYFKQKEKMSSRKMEMNDKLKSIQLLEGLNIDDSHKRDILSKIDLIKSLKKSLPQQNQQ